LSVIIDVVNVDDDNDDDDDDDDVPIVTTEPGILIDLNDVQL